MRESSLGIDKKLFHLASEPKLLCLNTKRRSHGWLICNIENERGSLDWNKCFAIDWWENGEWTTVTGKQDVLNKLNLKQNQYATT